METRRLKILQVPVDAEAPESFLSKAETCLEGQGTKTIFAVNPEKVMRAKADSGLLGRLNRSDFLLPDGVGLTLAIRLLRGVRVRRTTGIGFMQEIARRAEETGRKIFLFGAQDAVAKKAAINLKKQYPKLQIAGVQHGFLGEEEYPEFIEKLNGLNVAVLFVGLGSPKQEEWIDRYRDQLNVKLCMGVGGSFDVIAGNIKRAPAWLQKIGLEWLYRLVRQPQRIGRQLVLPRFAFAVMREKISPKES